MTACARQVFTSSPGLELPCTPSAHRAPYATTACAMAGRTEE